MPSPSPFVDGSGQLARPFWLTTTFWLELSEASGYPAFLYRAPPRRHIFAARTRNQVINARWVASSCFNYLGGGHQLSGRCIDGETCLLSLILPHRTEVAPRAHEESQLFFVLSRLLHNFRRTACFPTESSADICVVIELTRRSGENGDAQKKLVTRNTHGRDG